MNSLVAKCFMILFFCCCYIIKEAQVFAEDKQRVSRIIATIPVAFNDAAAENGLQVVPLDIRYKDLANWEAAVLSFAAKYQITSIDTLLEHVKQQLLATGVSPSLIIKQPPPIDIAYDSFDVFFVQLMNAVHHNEREDIDSSQSDPKRNLVDEYPLFVGANHRKEPLTDLLYLRCVHDPATDGAADCTDSALLQRIAKKRSLWPTYFTDPSAQSFGAQRILLYQNIGANSGGTIAIELLRDELLRIGLDAVLCSEHNIRSDERCAFPRETDVLLTGEWCNGVLSDYNLSSFAGRSVQYHLGFHHHSDRCRGHVTVADSHFITVLYEDRILGAYFLGCPMTNFTKFAYLDHISSSKDVSERPRIIKENLLIIDPDLLDDYPPEISIGYQFPANTEIVFAKNIPRASMPNYLLRAKAVLDLAMPGPERLAGEGLLFGCVPIVSDRWNGASRIDFPAIQRVDYSNSSAVFEAVVQVMSNYQELVVSKENSVFYSYMLSLWRKLHHTADVMFGSSKVHFMLSAQSVEQEERAVFQVLGLLYLYPLASIALYVRDTKWFIRHQYSFFTMLVDCGYVRVDPFDPDTFEQWKSGRSGTSFVNIRPLYQLEDNITNYFIHFELNNNGNESDYYCTTETDCPNWKPLVIALNNYDNDISNSNSNSNSNNNSNNNSNSNSNNNAFLFRNPYSLMNAIASMNEQEIRSIQANTNSIANHFEQVPIGVAISPFASKRSAYAQLSRILLLRNQKEETLNDLFKQKVSSLDQFSNNHNEQIDGIKNINAALMDTDCSSCTMSATVIDNKEVINVCNLLWQSVHSASTATSPSSDDNWLTLSDIQSQEYFHIFNITSTVPWQRALSRLQRTNGIEALC